MSHFNSEEVMQRIQQGETNTVELKASTPRPKELAERLCGMANAQGGMIIVGVTDHRKIVGISDTSMAIDSLLRAARQVEPTLVLDPPEPEIYTLEGKQLVIAHIPPYHGLLHQAGGVCWIRRGTYTVPLSVPQIFEAGHDRGLLSWELQFPLDATLHAIDEARVEAFLTQRSPKGRRGSQLGTLEEVLLGLKCARRTATGEVLPTNAGILFFGRDPQQYILQSEVVCVLFRNTVGTGGYIDRKNVVGTTVELIDETEAFLQKYVAIGARIEGWKRIDLPEYPLEALREAVVNAVVHRDYSREGESIRVFYYPDRVEIHSPGLLLPGITVEQMQRGDVISRLRNPTLTTLLREVPGYMERIGSGVRFMLQETGRMGLPSPIFRETQEFVVTFPKEPALAHEQQVTMPTVDLDQETRIARAMQHIQIHGSISNSEYQAINNVSDNTALRDLSSLVAQGALREVGKGRARRYKLP
jgi:ATP-dependent DNA helicase RecG